MPACKRPPGGGVVKEVATISPRRVTQKDRQRFGRLVPVRPTDKVRWGRREGKKDERKEGRKE